MKEAPSGSRTEILRQWASCSRDVSVFVRDCVWIYDATAQDWVRFDLWRIRGMYDRLPPCLHARAVTLSNETRWILSTGSRALAFSTRFGRSYTGTLSQFLNAVKPTIDAGGHGRLPPCVPALVVAARTR